MPHKKDPEDPRMLKIETEVARVAIKAFIEKLREWCETETDRDRLGAWKQGDWKYSRTLLDYAESLYLEGTKEES